MKMNQTFYARDRAQWRAWLKQNHDKEKEIWLIYYKKHSGRPRVSYNDAVEEALCFGWIDSLVHRIDENRYAQKFTPRKRGSRWSTLNRRRVRKLIQEGIMTRAGLATFNPDVLKEEDPKPTRREVVAPHYFLEAMKANPHAGAFFGELAPSHKRNIVLWVSSAKKQETRLRRLKEAVALLSKKQKLGMK
jgi:uncharacterized protein YdeI (YjbR/CyaY-like superfamily)